MQGFPKGRSGVGGGLLSHRMFVLLTGSRSSLGLGGGLRSQAGWTFIADFTLSVYCLRGLREGPLLNASSAEQLNGVNKVCSMKSTKFCYTENQFCTSK